MSSHRSTPASPPVFGSDGSDELESYDSGAEDTDVVTFYVHKVTEEKLWDRPPDAELENYERWSFDSISGEVTQLERGDEAGAEPVSRSPSPSPSASSGSSSRSASPDNGYANRLPARAVPPPVSGARPPPPVRRVPAHGGGAAPPRGPAPPAAGNRSGGQAPPTPGNSLSLEQVSNMDVNSSGGGNYPSRGPRPPTSVFGAGLAPEPEAYSPDLWLKSEEERRQRDNLAQLPVSAQGAEAAFDALEHQHRERRLAKLDADCGSSPPLRDASSRKRTETAADKQLRMSMAISTEVDAAANPNQDFPSSILAHPTCHIQVDQTSKSHKCEGKTVYYAIDVAAEGLGEWRVYRRFKMFLKLQETLLKDETTRTSAEAVGGLMPSKTYIKAANARDIETRKIRLDSYIKKAFADRILRGTAQTKGSPFNKFLSIGGTEEISGGGMCYRKILRVRVGKDSNGKQTSPMTVDRLRETLLDLLVHRQVPSSSNAEQPAPRHEFEREDNARLKALAAEHGIFQAEWSSARRFVWLDSRGDSPTLSFTHIEGRQPGQEDRGHGRLYETEAEIWELVDSGERPPIRTIYLEESYLNPDAKLRDRSVIEVIAPQTTLSLYTGSDLAWVHWMSLLAPLFDRSRMADYYRKHEFRGHVGEAVETLDAAMTVPDYSRVAKSAEFADFTYGRVKRSYAEPDPAKRDRIKSGMGVLADDINSHFKTRAGVWSPCVHQLPQDLSMTPTSVAEQLRFDGTIEVEFEHDLRASISATRTRRNSVSSRMDFNPSVRNQDVIVMDCGSAYLRIGFDSEHLPRLVKLTRAGGGGITPGVRGSNAVDWDQMASQWKDAFDELEINPADHKIVLTATAHMIDTEDKKEHIREILHEEMMVPYLRIESSATAILTSTGRQTGIVVDMGNSTEITAIAHGYPIPKASFFSPFGGSELTRALRHQLTRIGVETTDMDLVRKVKEECGRVADTRGEVEDWPDVTKHPDIMSHPDVRAFGAQLPRNVVCDYTEALFEDINEHGLHEHISDSIQNCDQMDRPELYRNIVIAGGSTCIKGFEERLSDELKTYVSKSVSVRAGKQIQLIAKAQRKYSAWIGAAKIFWDNKERVTRYMQEGQEISDEDESRSEGGSSSDDSADEHA